MVQQASTGIEGLGKAIKADLLRMDMSIDQMARHFSVSQQAVSGWITRNRIPAGRWGELASFFGGESETVRLLGESSRQAIAYPFASIVPSALGQAAIQALKEALASNRVSDQQLLLYIAEWKGLAMPALKQE